MSSFSSYSTSKSFSSSLRRLREKKIPSPQPLIEQQVSIAYNDKETLKDWLSNHFKGNYRIKGVSISFSTEVCILILPWIDQVGVLLS